jgi:PAT family beta-lactamase induction signal transducer AmpG
MTDQAAVATAEKPRRHVLWIAAALGFGCGLPYSLLVGSMAVWLTNAEVGFGTIGALSWIGLLYAFKFIWSPAFDWLVPPFANTIGRRRAWIALCQLAIAACLFGMTLFDPTVNLLAFAGFAVFAAFASASQDIVVDAWRIETAENGKQLDAITVQYQLGYRLAAILAGAVALLLADIWAQPGDAAAGWPAIWTLMSVLMAFAIGATLAAPEPIVAPRAPVSAAALDPETLKLRRAAALPVALGWALSGAALIGFMFYTLANPGASAAAFRDAATPWILLVTIGAPLAISFWLATKPGALEGVSGSKAFADILFERVLAPLADFVRRYWLWALPVLALAMTYRIADSIWGSFAQPFYIGILQHSNSDVAVASKMVGVVMTMAGIALGGVLVAWIGRMAALIFGGIVAAATNLLYADLAHGGRWIDGFLTGTGLGGVFDWALRGFVGLVESAGGATVFADVNLGEGLNRLTAVIAIENLAGGLASAVHLVWLSSIVNKSYAAVQYALLSSLALLVGVIFRPRIGSYVDAVKDQGVEAQADRFADVFIFAAWIGLIAVALAVLEWWRQGRAQATAPAAAPA